jgi:hypothetical protein
MGDSKYSIQSSYVDGNRIGFHSRVSSDDQVMLLGAIEVDLSLQLNRGVLSGTGTFTAGDGLRATYALSRDNISRK